MEDLGRTKIAEDDLITLGRNLRRGVRKVIYDIRKIGQVSGGEENSAMQNLSHIIEGNISWGREMRGDVDAEKRSLIVLCFGSRSSAPSSDLESSILHFLPKFLRASTKVDTASPLMQR